MADRDNYTRFSKLTILGQSNGWLLVADCLVQRPELFGAVICMAPITDMLRHHKFTISPYVVPEYGNAEVNPDHFKFLYAYSPLHNVKPGTAYPPTLIMTAENDDRVVPSHGYKFAAALQEAQAGARPILLRVERERVMVPENLFQYGLTNSLIFIPSCPEPF